MLTDTEATATAAIKITGQPYVDTSFDNWATGAVARWNRSRIHRLTGVSATTLQFIAQCRSGSSYTTLAVLSDGVLVAQPTLTADDVRRVITVSLPAGANKTVEIWEPFQARAGSLNSDADSTILAAYIHSVFVPVGATMAKRTAAVGIVVGVDSLCDGVADEPMHYNGWCGKLRQAAQAAGQLVGYYDYGSCTWAGDGRTPAQMANDVDRLYTDMGTTTPKLILLWRPNDWAYYQLSFFGVTAAQLATAYGTFLDALRALRPTLVVDCINTLPQTTTSPPGAESLATFQAALAGLTSGRSWVTMHDGTTEFGLSLPGDFVEGVHPNQAGHNKIWAGVRAYPNINL